MYIDCDSDYFPVKFLERVSAKYSHSPRVIRNGDDVRSVLPDGTLIKTKPLKGAGISILEIIMWTGKGLIFMCSYPKTGNCFTPGTAAWAASLPAHTMTRWRKISKIVLIRRNISV